LAAGAEQIAEGGSVDTAVAALVEKLEGFAVVCGGLLGVIHGVLASVVSGCGGECGEGRVECLGRGWLWSADSSRQRRCEWHNQSLFVLLVVAVARGSCDGCAGGMHPAPCDWGSRRGEARLTILFCRVRFWWGRRGVNEVQRRLLRASVCGEGFGGQKVRRREIRALFDKG